MNIARTVQNVINKNYFLDKIDQIKPSDDPRSYHIDLRVKECLILNQNMISVLR